MFEGMNVAPCLGKVLCGALWRAMEAWRQDYKVAQSGLQGGRPKARPQCGETTVEPPQGFLKLRWEETASPRSNGREWPTDAPMGCSKEW